jgi:hypothetical protein
MSSFLDINHLYKYQVQREESKKEYYEQIIKKIHNRIENYAMRNETMCICQIPEFVFGVPLYNRMTCCRYVIDRLKKEGFKVYYVEPYQIVINWAKDVIEPYVVTNPTGGSRGGGMTMLNNDDSFIKSILQSNPSVVAAPPKEGNKKPTYQPNGKLFDPK